MEAPDVKALVFDVFGTVVDWRSCVTESAKLACGDRASGLDWEAFADDWRTAGYLKPIAQIVAGTRPYVGVETLLAETLDVLLAQRRLRLGASELEWLRLAWHRLDPWPDAVGGLERLRRHYVLGPLSNGSFAMLTDMARRSGLPWDCILSTELFSAYKPDPSTYLGAARLLGLAPTQVMLVAAHVGDLRAAASLGLRTAYVPRPLEWGTQSAPPAPGDPNFDVIAHDFSDLADRLCPDGSLP